MSDIGNKDTGDDAMQALKNFIRDDFTRMETITNDFISAQNRKNKAYDDEILNIKTALKAIAASIVNNIP